MYNTEFKIIDPNNHLEILLYNDNKEIILDLSWISMINVSKNKFITFRNELIETINDQRKLDTFLWDYDDDEHYYYNSVYVALIENNVHRTYSGEIVFKVNDDNEEKKFNIVFDLFKYDILIELSDEDSNIFINKYIEICSIIENNNK